MSRRSWLFFPSHCSEEDLSCAGFCYESWSIPGYWTQDEEGILIFSHLEGTYPVPDLELEHTNTSIFGESLILHSYTLTVNQSTTFLELIEGQDGVEFVLIDEEGNADQVVVPVAGGFSGVILPSGELPVIVCPVVSCAGFPYESWSIVGHWRKGDPPFFYQFESPISGNTFPVPSLGFEPINTESWGDGFTQHLLVIGQSQTLMNSIVSPGVVIMYVDEDGNADQVTVESDFNVTTSTTITSEEIPAVECPVGCNGEQWTEWSIQFYWRQDLDDAVPVLESLEVGYGGNLPVLPISFTPHDLATWGVNNVRNLYRVRMGNVYEAFVSNISSQGLVVDYFSNILGETARTTLPLSSPPTTSGETLTLWPEDILDIECQ
jgi:hypothetical protein